MALESLNNPPLTFEEFSRREDIGGMGLMVPCYRGFFNIFRPTMAVQLDPADNITPLAKTYRKFRRENGGLYDEISALIQQIDEELDKEEGDMGTSLERADAKLYEAYLIMHEYEGVTDEILLS